MQNNSNPVLFVPEPPPELPAAQQKQIRDALCAVAARGERFPGELASVRVCLSREFATFNADCVKAARASKVKA
ncbi:hypothetical protein CBA19CS22_00675 [Caballeronia novacaledonica]|uniref:Uncharacterized protein n=1 Tax=Caballeronia novacaledonica TaxID=1544861 RepID=A0ACB5QIV9_9BURK|nr:hypothetical protein CBA19CS22_00675 [Caballeronia novacaledonica]